MVAHLLIRAWVPVFLLSRDVLQGPDCIQQCCGEVFSQNAITLEHCWNW